MKKSNNKNNANRYTQRKANKDFWVRRTFADFRIKDAFTCVLAILIFVVPLSAFGVISVLDKDKTISELENRTLKQAPKLTANALFNGNFTKDFDEYYADTFPMREFFLSINKKITVFLTQNAGSDDIVIIQKGDEGDNFAGEGILEEEDEKTTDLQAQ